MPCYVTGSGRGDLQLTRDEAREEAQTVTRMLCDLCRQLDKHPDDWEFLLDSMKDGEALKEWWEKHKDQDEES